MPPKSYGHVDVGDAAAAKTIPSSPRAPFDGSHPASIVILDRNSCLQVHASFLLKRAHVDQS
eukprot:42097-Eustigmatos_ZCMA.PRE.1